MRKVEGFGGISRDGGFDMIYLYPCGRLDPSDDNYSAYYVAVGVVGVTCQATISSGRFRCSQGWASK